MAVRRIGTPTARSLGALAGFIFCALALAISASPAAAAGYEFERTWEAQSPTGLAVDSQNNVYVVGDDQVQKFSSTGTLIGGWGGSGSAPGRFDTPTGIEIGPDGNVYVADYLNYRIQVFTPAGGFIRQWPVAIGGGAGEQVAPFDIDLVADGDVYIVHATTALDREPPGVQAYSSTGAFIGEFGAEGTGDGEFFTPRGLAVDAGQNLYVADSGNDRIQRFNSGGFVTKWGQSGQDPGQFSTPNGVDIGPDGNVYVAGGNERVGVFTPGGALITSMGSYGLGDGQFDCGPRDVAVDSQANVYAAETCFGRSRIQKFRPAGAAPPGGGGEPPGGPGPGTPGGNRVKIASKSLKYKQNKIKVKIKCLGSGQCKGKAQIKKGKKTKLAKGSYKLPAGKQKNATAKPTKRGKRQLKRAKGKLKVTVELKSKGGGKKVTKKLKLKG